MKTSLLVDNLKCGGCANSIQTRLNKVVTDVDIDVEKGKVSFSHNRESDINTVRSILTRMGYPDMGESTLSQKAKSYVSCAIGRMNKARV